MRPLPHTHVSLASLVALVLVAVTMGALAAVGHTTSAAPLQPTAPLRPQSNGVRQYVPILDSSGYTSTLGLKGARPAGMEGFGYSRIELQDRSSLDNAVKVQLKKRYVDDLEIERHLGPLGAAMIELKHEHAITVGRYSAIVWPSHPMGVIARSEWVSGAATAYEAPPADEELILPLLVRNVYSNTSILLVQNTDDSEQPNRVTLQIFNNDDGSLDVSLESRMNALAVNEYDTWFDTGLFGQMPVNAAGGSIAAMRIAADAPVAVMAYGDEMAGDATSAYVARPVADASTMQVLPVVRANYLGSSLIAIANASMSKAVDVTISYLGHEFGSGAGRGQRFEQQFRINERGAAFVDLGERGRGNQVPPALPRGGGRNKGFLGSAIVRASGPVLTVVQEEVRDGEFVRALAAYNGLGPGDLSSVVVVPRVYNTSGGGKTELVLMNPNGGPADVSLTFRDGGDGRALGSSRITVPADGSALIEARSHQPALPAASQLTIASDRPLAVLVCDTTLSAPSDWGRWGHDTTTYAAFGVVADYTPPPTPTATATHPPTSTPTVTPTPLPTSTSPPELPFRLYLPTGYVRYEVAAE